MDQCGWMSPPRTIISHCLPVPQSSECLSSKPCTTTTTNINADPIHQSIRMDIDTKSTKNTSNNILKFFEEFQKELEQIKDEYMMKFTRDRTSIEHEFNRLMNDERIAFEKVDRYLYDHRQRPTKSYDSRRNYN